MATNGTIFDTDAGIVHYTLTYSSTRSGGIVTVKFTLNTYNKTNYSFGYNIVLTSLTCAGTTVASNVTIKDNSPSTWNISKSWTVNISSTASSLSGVQLKMTSPTNVAAGGSSGVYTSSSVSIGVPAANAPSGPSSVSLASSRAKPDEGVWLEWGAGNGGSYTINHYCVDCRKYTLSSNSWSSFSNTSNLNSNYMGSFSSPTKIAVNARQLYPDAVAGDRIEFKVTMHATNYGYVDGATAILDLYKDGKIMIKDAGGVVREINRIKIKDSGGVVRDIQKVKIKDAGGTIRNIDLYWK